MSNNTKDCLINAFACIAVTTAAFVLIAAFVFGVWEIGSTVNHSASGKGAVSAKNNAAQAFYDNCSKKFKAGVYQEACVAAVTGR